MEYEEKDHAAVKYVSKDGKDDIQSHDDEAADVINGYDGSASWTDAEEHRLLRKIDWRLMPVLCVTCR